MTTDTTIKEPIDVSAWVGPVDPPEVAEVKAKVREVAMRYARRHNWCDAVNRALVEAGIDNPVTLRATLTTSHPLVFRVTLTPTDLHGKTWEQQVKAVARKVGPLNLRSDHHVEGNMSIPFPVDTVTDLTVEGPPTPNAASPDDIWAVTASGRVAHLWVGQFQNVTNGVDAYRDSACGGVAAYMNNLIVPTPPPDVSRCARCTRVVS